MGPLSGQGSASEAQTQVQGDLGLGLEQTWNMCQAQSTSVGWVFF